MASETTLETWTDRVAEKMQEAKSNGKRLNPVTAARKVVMGSGIFDKQDLKRLSTEIQGRLSRRSAEARRARFRTTSDQFKRQTSLSF